MRRIRVRFVGVVDDFNFFRSHKVLSGLGVAKKLCLDFDKGEGWVDLVTSHTNKKIDLSLQLELPEVQAAIEEAMEKDNADDHNRA